LAAASSSSHVFGGLTPASFSIAMLYISAIELAPATGKA
jgi:hypothetical protein